MKRKLKAVAIFIYLVTPAIVFAAPTTFKGLVQLFIDLFNRAVIPLIFALAFFVFLWGIFQYMFFPDSEENRTKGKNMIVYGLIGLAIMISVWGLVAIVKNTFFG